LTVPESTATVAQDLQRIAAAASKLENVKPELPLAAILRDGQLELAIPREGQLEPQAADVVGVACARNAPVMRQ
jgi:hypothetical protein